MESKKYALRNMVEAGMKAKKMSDIFCKNGLNNNDLSEIYDAVCEAIYTLIGEETETYDESVTYLVMSAPYLTKERRVEMLMAEYRKNHPELPKPNLMNKDEFRQMYKKNGGYMHETPEGGWT